LIGGGKVGEAKNFLYIIPGEDWGGGGRKGRFKKQFKRGKTIEKVYRKKGAKPPPYPPHPPPPKNVIQKTWLCKGLFVYFYPTLEGNYNGISLGEVFI
jgi:hypothetical protein